LSINGEPTSPFTIRIPANYTTLDNTWREVNVEVIDRLQAKSRKLYARTLAEVEEIVDKRYEEVLSAFTLGEDVEDVDHEAQIDEDDLRSLIG
jgi:hypothetical protein